MKLVFGLLLLFTLGLAAQAQEAKTITQVFASSESKVVKNSPFSADAVSESVQVLADGNRIVHSSSSKLYRNSEGRFRSEMKSGSGTLMGTPFTVMPDITIVDPVEGRKYLLDDNLKTAKEALLKAQTELNATKVYSTTLDAQKVDVEKLREELKAAAVAGGRTPTAPLAAMPAMPAMPAGPLAVITGGVEGGVFGTSFGGAASKYETKTEQLGTQNIEGVEAEGTRTTTVIPAGAIGNERPIEIVYERWYSKELQLVVMSKHSDPRTGEQTYRLTNINRSEPDPALFSMPAGYRLVGPMVPTANAGPRTQAVRTVSSTSAKPVAVPVSATKDKP